jgi:hypothetical protein
VSVVSHFEVTASATNTEGDSVFINNAATNGHPNAVVYASENFSVGGVCGCVVDPIPVGVWYDSGLSQWAVFQEDGSAMPAGTEFNIMVVPAATSSAFVQTATAANSASDYTLINDSAINFNSSAILQATSIWNPGGNGGVFDNHLIGVFYDTSAHRWGVFNEDQSAIPAGASFNIMVGSTGSNGGKALTFSSAVANTGLNTTYIDDPETTGNPNTVVFATPNFDPKGKGGIYDDNAIASWWNFSKEGISNLDDVNMPTGAAFNVLIFPS